MGRDPSQGNLNHLNPGIEFRRGIFAYVYREATRKPKMKDIFYKAA